MAPNWPSGVAWGCVLLDDLIEDLAPFEMSCRLTPDRSRKRMLFTVSMKNVVRRHVPCVNSCSFGAASDEL
jgi:hypothetical protein